MPLIRDISALKPQARLALQRFMDLLDAEKIGFHLSETLRETAVQVAYAAQGVKPLEEVNSLRATAGLVPITEKENKNIITKCDGIRKPSPHQSGFAADVYPRINGKIAWSVTEETAEFWKRFGALGIKAGFDWGGTWKPLNAYGIGWDAPHFEIPYAQRKA